MPAWPNYHPPPFYLNTAAVFFSFKKSTKMAGCQVLSLFIVVDQPREVFRSICSPHAFYTPSPQGLYEIYRTSITEMMMRHFNRYFPDLSSHIITVITTPSTIAARAGITGDPVTGWSLADHPYPAGYRFLPASQIVFTPIDTIKQAGRWTFNPADVPVTMATGKLAADTVIKDLKK